MKISKIHQLIVIPRHQKDTWAAPCTVPLFIKRASQAGLAQENLTYDNMRANHHA
ncbi:hypothetical protein [Methylobacter sp. YRD-M1]|uniref:hypothetical protein n=1 Tax=Methylobacter sp. YRD-M1 TaxID=2911520 RepID=UPI00227C8E7C|nr:hypothetical protein [Methylobacter sp. YRD-M1]WAK02525.1 hypothetical protein LZ558_01680 [Methylobacter sp. YRD-M1]